MQLEHKVSDWKPGETVIRTGVDSGLHQILLNRVKDIVLAELKRKGEDVIMIGVNVSVTVVVRQKEYSFKVDIAMLDPTEED